MNLIDLITGSTGSQVATSLEEKYGVDKTQIMALLATATPFIVSALQKNPKTQQRQKP